MSSTRQRPILWWEAFAGFMPVTLRLIAGRRSPGSLTGYIGGKAKHADDILGVMGLEPGQGADAAVVSDAGPLGWAWQGLVQPDVRAVVESTLRGWREKDAIKLWEECRAKPPPEELGEAIATHLLLQARTPGNTPLYFNESADDWWMSARAGRASTRARQKGTSRGKEAGLRQPETLADRVQAFGEAIATLLVLQSANARSKPVVAKDGRWVVAGYAHLSAVARRKGFTDQQRVLPASLIESVAGLEAVPWPLLAVLHGDVMLAVPQGDLDGVYCLLDPPYQGATPYAVACPREKVIALALDLHRRGAAVVVCEGVPLVNELGPDWYAVDLSGQRAWQTWTARQSGEWLTVNRLPAKVPMRQVAIPGLQKERPCPSKK